MNNLDSSRAQLAPFQPREDRVTLRHIKHRAFEAIAFALQISRVILAPKKGRHTR